MPRRKPVPPHYRGDYKTRAAAVRAAAYADPSTRCWRCGKTLAEHRPHKTGKPARWTAGHVHDGNPLSALKPEASTCNYSAGATAGNIRRRQRPPLQTTRRW